ncbi:glycosyltransferase [Pararhodospirillum oryzae]|uniref:Uncharacterized protein n=1 Tax=Pararhodospirillum oryzae TaxID=478448 RepID=A0A512H904_9PROT|nr:glycosyltransferase [Pararhodospirillum oryzae]GEO81933.1 hypothetical protein ROR02_20640 [Pararhodospirillum oryzae]
MRIVLIEDGAVYDGETPARRPLGGLERAVCALAAALADRGHEVQVLNRAPRTTCVSGVLWSPLPVENDALLPGEPPDAVIAVADPALFHRCPDAPARVLWALGTPEALGRPDGRAAIEAFRPALALPGLAAYNASPVGGGTVVPCGIDPVFRPAWDGHARPEPPEPPVAIVTTHPLHGLAEVLDLWEERIHPAIPAAALHVYSARLACMLEPESGPLDPLSPLGALAARARALAPAGVEVRAPLPSKAMAEVYQKARVHVYPGHPQDMICWTLADSQASGLPAVARQRGACADRIVNGESGYLVPDTEALANVTLEILRGPEVWRSLAGTAARPERRRAWETVALSMERLMTV